MNKLKQRPVNLDLIHIRLPVMGIVSILHRISGLLLIILLPYGVFLFDLSLTNEQGFLQVRDLLASIPAKILLTFVIWLLSHHVCAGIRFLLIDIELGVSKQSARTGAWAVHLATLTLTLLLVVVLLL
ncbi:MAG: succinate dehydrogenase, cytochrome b556 subunit [Thiohalomonadales bacterium]